VEVKMLEGALVPGPSAAIDPAAIQQMVLANLDSYMGIKAIAGSFKKVFPVDASYAVACVHNRTPQVLLQQEGHLLTILRTIEIPANQFYGKVFPMSDTHHGVVMDWLPNTILIDSKDMDSRFSQIIAHFLGIDVPKGEGWVLQKGVIEAQMRHNLKENPNSFTELKKSAFRFSEALKDILAKLDKHQYMIADLQLLVNNHGAVWFIDPFDVVKVKDKGPNKKKYTSLKDKTVQTDTDFIRQLHDGQQLLRKCIEWCDLIKMAASEKALLEMVFKSPEMVISPRSGLLRQVLAKTSPRTTPVDSEVLRERSKSYLPLMGRQLRADEEPISLASEEDSINAKRRISLPPPSRIIPIPAAAAAASSSDDSAKSKENVTDNSPPSPSKKLATDIARFRINGSSAPGQ
jgi:hypothetical protein